MSYLLDGKSVADFRSDTVTRPSPAMREAMARAVVGDDVFGDDPTVLELEARAAALFGKEAGLFVPSGTMGNLIAMIVHARPGDEVLMEERSHTYNNEVGGAGAIAHVLTRTLPSSRGQLEPEVVRRACRPANLHNPRTALLIVENTHNFWGGAVVPLERLRALADVARSAGVALHLDGARIFNACVATGTEPRAWGGLADSLMFCLSKGLGAPVGSLLVGAREAIERGRRVRKSLGGGLRQAGVLAAPGLVALEEGPRQLPLDHQLAKALARGVAAIPGAVVDVDACETNILFVRTERGADSYAPIADGLRARGVLAVALGELGLRFVTHRDVDGRDVERALEALRDLLAAHGRAGAARW